MHTIKLTILIISLFCTLLTATARSYQWPIKELDTARDVEYLNDTEKDVVLELNKFRHNPKQYAAEYIQPLAKYYDGIYLKQPGQIWLQTNEGVKALNECVRELNKAVPAPILYASKGMTLACRDLVKDQSDSGRTGHNDKKGNDPFLRMKKYGQYVGYAAENVHYGINDPVNIIVSLAIDDGVKSRGHRKNMLDKEYHVVGVAVGAHKIYENMCVQDFASKYIEK